MSRGFLHGGRLSVDRRIVGVPGLQGSLRILHLSDIHLQHGDEALWKELNACLSQLEPFDFITIGGDILGQHHPSNLVEGFFKGLPDIPKIAVLGNHDIMHCTLKTWLASLCSFGLLKKYIPADTAALRKELVKRDIVLLEHHDHQLLIRGIEVNIFGMRQPGVGMDHQRPNKVFQKQPEQPSFNLLMVHRPDVSKEHVSGYDLVVGGHTHGGQIHFPGKGAMVSHCGVAPVHAAGHYRIGETDWIVNNGFCATHPRIRYGAKRQISVIEIHDAPKNSHLEELKCH